MRKKRPIARRYVTEFNRCGGDNITRLIRRLRRLGYEIERVPQPTTITVTPPPGYAFAAVKADLRAQLQPRRGSLILASTSGRVWSCSMRGNRPGDFVRVL